MRVLFLTLFIVLTDQVTKFLVKGGTIPFFNIHVQGMDYASSINVINDFFKITFVENPGIAFGIDIDQSLKMLLTGFTLLASLGILVYLYNSREEKLVIRLALALILGGAIGNLIDRMFYGVFYGYAPLFYGNVVDFFNVDFWDFTIFGRTYDRWPIFNIADASVSIGVVLLLIFHHGSKPQNVNEEIAAEVNSSKLSAEEIPNLSNEILEQEKLSTIENNSVIDGEDSNRKTN